MQYKPNPPGRPLTLNEEKIEHILSLIPEYLIPAQIARAAQIPQRTLNTWLELGVSDSENGIDSIYAQFSLRFEMIRSEAIKKLVDDILLTGKWDAIMQILQVADRETFGKDSAQVKELIGIVSKLQKGEKLDVQESQMDTKCD